ncbi:patatin-like phospholipase family protein [Foetidibacter luteolus]|uniref:patatin-like phospholipase family protein n=1 Tax=Foetidibacter luteolus TaxID=2608880 RepID=UPI00129A1ADF|nr:patatin-like phospholipase family protein [Foetidibacter luteolus]
MRKYLVGFIYSMPIQLLFLHFRRYQVLLVFWYILFATVGGAFMETFGAYSLYLAPEYLGKVSPLSIAIVGFTVGIFIMSWNITTFILHSRHITFLATTSQPFLKYCINNGIIPLAFLLFYFTKAVGYADTQELLSAKEIILLSASFLGGYLLCIFVAFGYFFGADKTIYRRFASVIDTANVHYALAIKDNPLPTDNNEVRIDWFLSARLNLRKPRDVRHYSQGFLEAIFKRHHVAAVIAIFLSFVVLLAIGFFGDNPFFQFPAAASITVFFAILIAVAGAVSLFLRSWSFPVLVVLYVLLNWLYQNEVIDLRNKAYGLNYAGKKDRPKYERDDILQLASDSNVAADRGHYLQVLENWKARQDTGKPVAFIINVSGGGSRSAAFAMNVLQYLDSLTNGTLMQRTVLISGASGGMFGAAYFRELYNEKINGRNINLRNRQYVDNISRDLLNPLFSSFVSRDLTGPSRKFSFGGYEYVKDRAYAFEQRLNENTGGILNKRIADYAAAEQKALIPIMFFNAVISRDARKMIVATHPARFLMRPTHDSLNINPHDPDAVDFTSLFDKQDAANLSVLSALRMNATFPYVLPNVWLPTEPVIDVMDAGLRDNYGQEVALRFTGAFEDWFKQNTRKVVLIQIRDRRLGDWEKPYDGNSILSFVTKPFLLLQNNWQKLQDYYQGDQLEYMQTSFGNNFHRLSFQYVPSTKDAAASLSFHLTASEKADIAAAVYSSNNQRTFKRLAELMK